MKRLVVVLLLALSATSAFAQEADETPRRLNTMSLREREHELEQQNFNGASGFWTSPYKSKQPYRYRLMLIGCALVLGTGLVVVRLMKKANAERAARNMGKLGRKDGDKAGHKADDKPGGEPGNNVSPPPGDDDPDPPADGDPPRA